MTRKTSYINIDALTLDLDNFRTLKQADETHALKAMIGAHPEWFWPLTESILEHGYLPTENIIVLHRSNPSDCNVVMEGNRRVGAMKLIRGDISDINIQIPSHIREKIGNLSADWRRLNSALPCIVFEPDEQQIIDELVTRVHGKGDKTGRDPWSAVARARHNREKQNKKELGLDLLEKWLRYGKNLTDTQRERFGASYNLSVLDEAINRIWRRIGLTSPVELVSQYPGIADRDAVEQILFDIGQSQLTFPALRNTTDILASNYGLKLPIQTTASTQPVATQRSQANTPTNNSISTSAGSTPPPSQQPDGPLPSPATNSTQSNSASVASNASSTNNPISQKAVPSNTSASVKRTLKAFRPNGNDRAKIATLAEELRNIDIKKCPHAFCMVLRTLFELSAKDYCQKHAANHAPSILKPSGQEKPLATLLKEIAEHIIGQSPSGEQKAKEKELHGAIVELNTPARILSVASMNALVHNRDYSVDEHHICLVFNNIFPFLRELNS